MRRVVAVVLALGLAVSIASAQAGSTSQSSGGQVERQITQWMDQSREAALKGDTSWSEKHLADNFTSVNAMGERVTSKSDAISRMKQGRVKYQSIDVSERHVTLQGDSAIYQGRAKLKATRDGQDISGEYWGTWFWVKQGGTWKLVASQSTPVREAGK